MSGDIDVLALFDKKMSPYIRQLAKRFWVPPHIICTAITKILCEDYYSIYASYPKIIVSGETDSISVYLIGKENTVVFTPFRCVRNNVVLQHALPEVLAEHQGSSLCLVRNNRLMETRLSFPKIILVNPSVKDVFPAPRLALSVASIAGYLRKHQKADVRIVDMQIGATVDTIIEEVQRECPDIVGISISFGQLVPALSVLTRLFREARRVVEVKPIIIVGNVIASFAYQGLLERFPELLVCNGEGESTMIALADYAKGECELQHIPGITYLRNGLITQNPVVEIDIDDAPLPSMDTIEGIIQGQGALTMEISRGCFHSACSFCPRTNKCRRWKGMSADVVLVQLAQYGRILDDFDSARRVFMADEEFVGWMTDGMEANRITAIANGMIRGKFKISFETNTRVDQIYSSGKNKEWHIERMKMLSLCKKAGLDRLLIGVESGSSSVLERFNKRISPSDSIMACRILTSLGIGIRITFITFDPLMNFSELRENIAFLERTDAFLKRVRSPDLDYSGLFEDVHDIEFVSNNSLNQPFYQLVSYMLVNLEVLMNTPYSTLLGKELFISNRPDLNMVRYDVVYRDKTIGDIAVNCQKWIDKHFALDYYLKGLYKITYGHERRKLFSIRAEYRKLSFLLLKSLAWLFDQENLICLHDDRKNLGDMMVVLGMLKKTCLFLSSERESVITSVLELFEGKMLLLVGDIEESIARGEIKVGKDDLARILESWKKVVSQWKLINPSGRS